MIRPLSSVLRLQCLLLVFCGVLQGCAPMFNKALTAENRTRVRDVEVQVLMPQETVIFSADSPNVSAAMGGGLIPALIDASVQRSRQEAMSAEMAVFLDRLVDIDFRGEGKAALADGTSSFALKVSNAEVLARIPTRTALDARIAKTKGGSAFMRVLVYYSLDPKSLTLTTRSHAQMWQDGVAERSYAGSFIYQEAAPAALAGAAPGAEAAAVRDMMRRAVLQTLRMASLDINQPMPSTPGASSASGASSTSRTSSTARTSGTHSASNTSTSNTSSASRAADARPQYMFAMGGSRVALAGELLASDGDRVVFRDKGGVLFSVQSAQK
jgi:hypothetical protein